jgi:hypothetical protein
MNFRARSQIEELEKPLGVNVKVDGDQFNKLFFPDFESKCTSLVPKAQTLRIMDYVSGALSRHKVDFDFRAEDQQFNFNIRYFMAKQNVRDIKLNDNFQGEATTYFYGDLVISNDKVKLTERIGFYVKFKFNFSISLFLFMRKALLNMLEGDLNTLTIVLLLIIRLIV